MRIKALAAGIVLSWAAAAFAQTAPAPSPFKFEMHGFASGSVFMQDGALSSGSGQIGYVVTSRQPTEDKLMFGADFRQSRFAFSVTGPQVFGGATPKGLFEIDWMGGFGAGNNGEIHLLPRLRIGYAELNWGAHRILFGVNADLTAALGPVTLAHNGAPYFLVSGNMGFRRPGIFGYHTFGDLKDPKAMKFEFSWEIARSQWTDAATQTVTVAVPGVAGSPFTSSVFPGTGNAACSGNIATNVAPPAGSSPNVCAGEASGLPALQARLAVSKGANFSAFVAGHWNRVDRNGMGNIDWVPRGINSSLDVIGGNAGAKVVVGPLTLAGGGYVGKNLGPLYGGIGSNFFTVGGDVHEYGLWTQGGFNLTKELSVWEFIGMDRINDSDLPGSGYPVNRSVVNAAMLQYRDGGYAIGVEWVHFRLNYDTRGGVTAGAFGSTAGVNDTVQIVNQVLLTGIYYF